MTIRRLGGLLMALVVVVAVTSVAAGAAIKKDVLVGAGKRLASRRIRVRARLTEN